LNASQTWFRAVAWRQTTLSALLAARVFSMRTWSLRPVTGGSNGPPWGLASPGCLVWFGLSVRWSCSAVWRRCSPTSARD